MHTICVECVQIRNRKSSLEEYDLVYHNAVVSVEVDSVELYQKFC